MGRYWNVIAYISYNPCHTRKQLFVERKSPLNYASLRCAGWIIDVQNLKRQNHYPSYDSAIDNSNVTLPVLLNHLTLKSNYIPPHQHNRADLWRVCLITDLLLIIGVSWDFAGSDRFFSWDQSNCDKQIQKTCEWPNSISFERFCELTIPYDKKFSLQDEITGYGAVYHVKHI